MAEILLALTLLSSICWVLMSVWITHSKAVDKAQHLMAATHIAETHLAEQMGLSFRASDREGTTRVTRFLDDVPHEYVYTWRITVEDTTTTVPDLKHVKCTVEWDEQGLKRSVEMVTSVYWQG